MKGIYIAAIVILVYILLQFLWTGYFMQKSKTLMAQTSYPHQLELGRGKEISILFLGDSITAGTGTNSFDQTLVYKITKNLSDKNNVKIKNLAISGNKVADLLKDDVPPKSDYTIIFIGSNDLFHFTKMENFEDSTKKVLDKWADSADKVILIGPANVGGASAIPIFMKPFYFFMMPKYGKTLEKVSKNYPNVKYVYPGEYMEMLKRYGNTEAIDGFHPNENGNSFWADVILKNLD